MEVRRENSSTDYWKFVVVTAGDVEAVTTGVVDAVVPTVGGFVVDCRQEHLNNRQS